MNLRKLRRLVAESFAGEPRWQIIVNRCDWLCPYCGEIGARNLSADSEVEVLLIEHLTNVCGQWSQGEGELLPMKRLKKRRRSFEFHFKIRRLLRKEKKFKLQEAGRWVCPYCASSTDVQVPDDLKGVGIESPFLNGVIAHLIPCQEFARGQGKTRGWEELRSQFSVDGSESQERDERERFAQKLASSPLFRLLDVERGWLCPYCGRDSGIQFLAGGKVDPKIVEAAWQHVKVCRDAHKMPSIEELKKRLKEVNRVKLMAQVRRKLEGHAVWQVFDLDNVWYCPYCALPTRILFPVGIEPDDRLILKVLRHVLGCSTSGGAKIMTLEQIEAAAERTNENIRMRNELKPKLRGSDSYTFFEAETGAWICPHCVEPVEDINFRAGDELTVGAQGQFVGHLLVCDAYLENPHKIASPQELEARFGMPSPESSGEIFLDSDEQAYGDEGSDDEEEEDVGDMSSGELIFYSEDDEASYG